MKVPRTIYPAINATGAAYQKARSALRVPAVSGRGRRDMGWSMIDQLLVSGMSFLSGLAFARLLGIAEFGRISLVLLLAAQSLTLQDYLLSAPMMTLAGRRARSLHYFGCVARLHVLGSLAAAIAVTAVVAGIFIARDGRMSFGLVSAAFAITLAQNLHSALRRIFFAQNRGRTAFSLDAGRYATLAIAGGILWLCAAPGTLDSVDTLFLIAACAALPVVVASKWMSWPDGERRLLRAVLARHWLTGRWLTLMIVVSMGQEQLVPIIVAFNLGDAAIGGLRAGQYLLGVTHFILMALANFVPQRAAQASAMGGPTQLGKYIAGETLALAVPTCGLIAVLGIFAEFWLAKLFGAEFVAYAAVLRIYCVSYVLIFIRELWIHYLRTIERTRATFEAFTLGSVVALLMIYPAIGSMGIEGAAAVILVANLVSTIYILGAVYREHSAATALRLSSQSPGSQHQKAGELSCPTSVLILAAFLFTWGAIISPAKSETNDEVVLSLEIKPQEDASAALDALLGKARDLRRRRPEAQIAIELPSGDLRLSRTIALDERDSATADHPLVIRGSGGSTTRLRGDLQLQEMPEGFPATVRDVLNADAKTHVKVFKLPKDVAAYPAIDIVRHHDRSVGTVPFEIFDGLGALWPARWPNDDWGQIDLGSGKSDFRAPSGRLQHWQAERELWAAGYWGEDWAFETRPVKSGDGVMTLAEPPEFGMKAVNRFYIYHALSELDAPGEWYRDRSSQSLIVWPRDGGGNLSASVTKSAIAMQGTSHVRLENVSIERFSGDAVQVVNCKDVVVQRVEIRWVGGRAVVFTAGTGNGVENSTISDTGQGGILLGGGNRMNLTAGGNFVRNSKMERFARLGHTLGPAVTIEGVGNIVSGNYIANAPHMAILFKGNNHTIERNEITGVVAETSDAGAIYTGRDWTAQGTIIRWNYLHDLRAAPGFEIKGIYLDDLASGITIDGNIFLRVDQPVFIGGGRDNYIMCNLFVAAAPAIHIDGRGITWGKEAVADPEGEIRARLRAVPFTSMRWRKAYPLLVDLLSDDPGAPKRNSSKGNVVLHSEAYRLLPEVKANEQVLDPAVEPSLSPQQAAAAVITTRASALANFPWIADGSFPIPFAEMDRSLGKAGREATP